MAPSDDVQSHIGVVQCRHDLRECIERAADSVEVSDRGEGVDPAIAPKVFERSVSTGGTGLGLGLARDLADAAGGRLELRSARPAVFALFLSAGEPPATGQHP